MKIFVALVTLLHVARGGYVSSYVRLPYQNPAGVTYINGFNGYQEAGAPLQYTASAIPARIEAQHVGYAAAQVPTVAAVPYVKHIPTVSQVPVTTYEHHPAVIEKQVDVLKPALSTRKIEVRRPAIQKQFYDIEERVIIRPAGSALIELKEPSSQLQKGPAVVQPLTHGAPLYTGYQQFVQNDVILSSSTPAPAPIPTTPSTPVYDEEGISVENPEFRSTQIQRLQEANAIYGQRQQQLQKQSRIQEEQLQQQQQQQQQIQEKQLQQLQQQQLQQQQIQFRAVQDQQQQQIYGAEQQQQNQQQAQQQQSIYGAQEQQSARSSQNLISQVETKSNGASPLETIARIAAREQSPSLIPTIHRTPEESLANQNRLIDLLTARGDITEIGYSQNGQINNYVGDVGQVEARVVSATPAPEGSNPADERISTRRVVVTRPIETLDEQTVVEPATKLVRIAYQHPTFIKTARLDHVQVHGSVPVVGKALTTGVAHAAVPLFQKTISHGY